MQNLLIFQSLWAMEQLRSDTAQVSLEKRIRRIVDAGFDGISGLWLGRDDAKSIWEATRGTTLQIEGICAPQSVDDLKRTLDFTAEFPIRHLDIQADIRPKTLDACATIVEGWLRLAEQVSYPIYFETHRNCLTNDLSFTLELLRRYPAIKLLADLSHYVVAHEFEYPITDERNDAIHEILDNAWAYHGRVASSEQVQIELSFPCHRKWVDQFRGWWTQGLRNWRKRAAQDESLVFTCELGPQPYAIAGSDGLDLADRWAESLQLRDMALECWHAASSYPSHNNLVASA